MTMNQTRSIIDTIQDPAALDRYLRSSSRAHPNPNDYPKSFAVPPQLHSTMPAGHHVYTPSGPTVVPHQMIRFPPSVNMMHTQPSMLIANGNGNRPWIPSHTYIKLAQQNSPSMERTWLNSNTNPNPSQHPHTHHSSLHLPHHRIHAPEQSTSYTTHTFHVANQTQHLSNSSTIASTSMSTSTSEHPINGTRSTQGPTISPYRFINLADLQAQGLVPLDLTHEQTLLLQKLESGVAKMTSDKQQRFINAQRDLVPKYFELYDKKEPNNSGGATTSSQMPVDTPSDSINRSHLGNKRAREPSIDDRIDQQLRQEQSHALFHPTSHRRFSTRADALKQLTPYHLFSKPNPPDYEPTLAECQKFDQLFENVTRRLSDSAERITRSIQQSILVNNQSLSNTVHDRYLLEKIQLDDLREEFESEKSESPLRKRHKSLGDDDVFDLVLTHSEPVMSDDAYFDLFNSDA